MGLPEALFLILFIVGAVRGVFYVIDVRRHRKARAALDKKEWDDFAG